jgi:hypothetical protein
MDDNYTTTPTHLRVWNDGKEWFVDAADNEGRYTESCWSADSFEEAVSLMQEFVEAQFYNGVTFRWDANRKTHINSL